jgi:hypothetical protein
MNVVAYLRMDAVHERAMGLKGVFKINSVMRMQ